MTQRESNPFPFSDSDKRYHTYDYYLRHAFGEKCAKITLDGGFTCPNRDGRCGVGGCIYCGESGSGEFTAPATLPIAEQYRIQRERLAGKWDLTACIPYFQPHSNTYAPVERLRALYEEALALPHAVGLNIATRADCLPRETVDLLAAFSERTTLTLELGLQTIHDETAARIGRGHGYDVFLDAWQRMREHAPHVRLCVHLIFGLVGENDEMMLETAKGVARLLPDEVKIHYLYVSEGTEMARIYRSGGYLPLTRERYVSLVVRALEHLPPTTVIGRLTGDGDRDLVLAPRWGCGKRKILNEIDKKFYGLDTMQGKKWVADRVVSS